MPLALCLGVATEFKISDDKSNKGQEKDNDSEEIVDQELGSSEEGRPGLEGSEHGRAGSDTERFVPDDHS